MNHRILAAGLFGSAAFVLFLVACPFTGWRVAAVGAAWIVPVAALAGALAAPRLAADALSDEDDNGLLGGSAVTLGTYVFCCLALTVYALAMLGPLGPTGSADGFDALIFGLHVTFAAFAFGGLFLVPAFLPGMAAGWVFYHHVRASSPEATSAT